MKLDWLKYLCDPVDGSELSLVEATQQEGDRVITGKLASQSGRCYDIRDGIPIFAFEGMQSLESVESFAFEWNEFGFLYAKAGWLQDFVGPLVGGLDFFKNKVVIDAGAGSGAQSRWMAEAGATLVISLELSNSIFGRHRETIADYKDVIFPIQCDIAHPPVRNKPDILYCINVIQHTANPRQTFANLARLVGQDTTFLFNIYTKRSELKFQVVRAVRRLIRFLPFKIWKWLAFIITAVAYPLAKIPFLLGPIRIFVPISHSFYETWLDVYDAFGGHHYQQNMSPADQLRMIKEEGLTVLRQAQLGYVLTR
jgi:2-polyprenyl-3-methyl-5-hydroxy-6-metoxy-1,4-benzoquinol methylase